MNTVDSYFCSKIVTKCLCLCIWQMILSKATEHWNVFSVDAAYFTPKNYSSGLSAQKFYLLTADQTLMRD